MVGIPNSEVLEDALLKVEGHDRAADSSHEPLTEEREAKAKDLALLGHELRLAGFLLQAVEAFRRAVRLNARDPWLLFGLARCLRSLARAESRRDIDRKASALLRLCERRARGDGQLLSRLGEIYFQIGETRRAAAAFRRAADVAEKPFRVFQGLAEIALREGKIAHAILNFTGAAKAAVTPALRRWAESEAEYFSRLNEDEDYVELEMARVRLLDTLLAVRKGSVKLVLLSLLIIAFGTAFEMYPVANAGWVIAWLALATWLGARLLQPLMSRRIPFDLVKEQ